MNNNHLRARSSRTGGVVRLLLAVALSAVAPAVCATTAAMDFTDVRMMMENGVPEEVIVDMAERRGGIVLTPAEVDALRRAGASEDLVDSLAAPFSASEDPGVEPGASGSTPADGTAITPLPVTAAAVYPALGAKEGWLSISNRDWQPYFLIANGDDRNLRISRGDNGGTVINPGENIVLGLRKREYRLYGDSGEKLDVRIRENLITTLSLEPFGVVGNSGLAGVVDDRGKIKSRILAAPYAPAERIIVEPAPVVIVPQPQVIVMPPPPAYRYDPWRRRGWHR